MTMPLEINYFKSLSLQSILYTSQFLKNSSDCSFSKNAAEDQDQRISHKHLLGLIFKFMAESFKFRKQTTK